MIKKTLALLIIFGVAFGMTLAQTVGPVACGTIVTAEQKLVEDTITVKQAVQGESLPSAGKYLSICVFVVNNKNRIPGIADVDIQSAVNNLTAYFSRAGIGFKIDGIRHVENYQFDSLSMGDGNNERDLVIQNYQPNMINLYLVTSLFDINQIKVKGATYLPGDKMLNTVFLSKNAISETNLAHQLGHFLNLYHTHERYFGNETVNETSCTTLGDRCCDTDADPRIDYKVSSTCIYTGNAKDANGQFYNPSVKNLMSFSNDGCRCYFTNSQCLRMIHCLKYLRTDLR